MTTPALKTPAFPLYQIKGRDVEYKTFRFQLKSFNEAEGTVTGYLSTFGNVDLQKDRVIRGAFKKTLTEAYARKTNGRKYLFAFLWMHDPNQPIGGFIDAQEDSEGLLVTAQLDISTNTAGIPNNPLATMVFSGFKMGYIDEMSMGYLAIQKDFESGIRNLKECALLEGSAVTMLFAANPEALVPASGVKAMLTKTASGKTTWPLAARDLAWDNGEAHNAIVKWATKSDGSLDQGKMQSVHFWYDDSAPDKITSYKFLFCDVIGGDIKAVPRAIFACTGEHGLATADIPDGDVAGVKAKIATYYTRMASEFDDDSIVVPWSDDSGKRRGMRGQRKDFNDVHQAGKAADCLEDWCDLLNDLTQTMFQIFGMSDSPESDMQTCLEQFGQALISEWTAKAIEANVGQYLNDRGYCSPTTSAYVPYSMQAGSDYGYMSRSGSAAHKAGRTISAQTQATIENHQQEMKDLLDQHTSASDQLAQQFKSMVKDHCAAMQQKVSDLTQLWAEEGQGPAYTNDTDSSDSGKSRLARREPSRTLPRQDAQPSHKSGTDDVSLEALAALL